METLVLDYSEQICSRITKISKCGRDIFVLQTGDLELVPKKVGASLRPPFAKKIYSPYELHSLFAG